MDTPVVTLPSAWRYKVNTMTGRPSISILCLGEIDKFDLQVFVSA